ncbi:MAG TPA: hypothetical protein VGF45_16940 [Polyangia bacterium]
MKNSSLKNLVIALVVTAASACASTSNSVAPASLDARLYTQNELNRIVAMREAGASLAEVASVVGGTRSDVRDVERALRASRGTVMQPAPTFSLARK